ncbi:MAG: Bax inhibitor-1/YccA family protein [Bacteroidetes bacterium]|uniref:Bax inhibitor-1/YccA family protein n=1 Tax=Candidatus Caccoplasma merdipullorum TaxID=2840718 RepID=A0A9D9E422_9BACT|nr:Bax inhibitor-1/YccA family protein [Candidatus Caccoplasma merdipullorum]
MNFENLSSAANVSKTNVAQLVKNVYMWMTLALGVTGVVSLAVAGSEQITRMVLGNSAIFWVLLIAEIGLVFYISARIMKISFATATTLFMLYSVLNGLTLSVLFAVYTKASIASAFFVTAGTFGVMSLYGYFTKRDLSSLGNILFMALIGLIIATVVNIFFFSETFYWVITYAGVLIFVGLTIYDTQKIKRALEGMEINETSQKLALLGALTLYLDFINLFLYILRILGDRR